MIRSSKLKLPPKGQHYNKFGLKPWMVGGIIQSTP